MQGFQICTNQIDILIFTYTKMSHILFCLCLSFENNIYICHYELYFTFSKKKEKKEAKPRHFHCCSQTFGPNFIYVYVNDKFSKPDKSFSLLNLLSLLGRLLGFICTSSQLSVTDGREVFERHKSMNFSLQCASRDIFTLMGHILPTSLLLEKKNPVETRDKLFLFF